MEAASHCLEELIKYSSSLHQKWKKGHQLAVAINMSVQATACLMDSSTVIEFCVDIVHVG